MAPACAAQHLKGLMPMPRKRRSTKSRIVKAAWNLFFKNGYDRTTVDDIIAASKTSKGTFYHYFKGKEALLNSLSYLFDEKYEGEVRVVSMGEVSKELCGGTHVCRTGDIGYFVIVADESIASGVRRIEALVGASAIEYQQAIARYMAQAGNMLHTDNFSVVEKIKALIEHNNSIEHENMLLKEKLVHLEASALAAKAVEIKGVKCVIAEVNAYSMRELRLAVDELKNTLGTCAVVLGSVENDKVNLIAALSRDLTSKVKAGDLVNAVAHYVDGKGGGRPDMAQAGGNNPAGLKDGLAAAPAFLEERL